MRKLTAWTICLLVIAVASAQALAQQNAIMEPKKLFTKHFNSTAFDITKNAMYSVEVLPNDKEYPIGKGTVGVVVHNARDEDVKGAGLGITYKNLDTGKVITPTGIKDKHNGLYIVTGLGDLYQPGNWSLAITVDVNGAKDGVDFKLPEAFKKPYPKGRYSP
ncbi:MAG: hypothetical protein M0018_00295 [Nitrospiraceae bacterium]|nr:hypothetical protein [Nitrospiraceae bacterium]